MKGTNFFIHGNGLNSTFAPKNMLSADLPGHSLDNWDTSKYSMLELVEHFEKVVPKNSTVWGHSLGGHIAINLGLIRKDIKVICFGMVPLNSLSEIGTLMTPYKELANFQNPSRSEEDVKSFLKYSSLDDEKLLEELYQVSKNQDPIFNTTLFSTGISDYDWNEQIKAKKLDQRFVLILSKNEKLYDFELAKKLDLNILINHYHGHCPWILNPDWTEQILNLTKTK